jgi:hypothetical protein
LFDYTLPCSIFCTTLALIIYFKKDLQLYLPPDIPNPLRVPQPYQTDRAPRNTR